MLELISVVALAAIGVAFTSYQGERDSSAVARKSALEDADEQIDSVGIFGHDVGRRLRDRFRQIGGRDTATEPHSPEDLDEADALAARLSATLDQGEDTGELTEPDFRLDPEQTDALIADAMQQGDVVDADMVGDAPGIDAEGFEAPLEEGWTSALETPAPAAEPVLVGLDSAPVISDFDPARDQIVLEYRPEDAGSGRVGIVTDDRHPGAALITLGGRVVAVVQGGADKVSAGHVELVQETPGSKTAAA